MTPGQIDTSYQAYQWPATPIIQEIRAQRFAYPHDVIVCAGSAMELYGLRQAHDIDILTTEANILDLLTRPGWHEEVRGLFETSTRLPVRTLSDKANRFDVWNQWYDGSRPPGQRNVRFETMVENSVPHPGGFRVITPSYLLHVKRAHNRPKDQADIERLARLLE